MIPIKIISKEKAIELGWSTPLKHSGTGGMGAGAIVNVNSLTGKETKMESFIEKDGIKELTFISEERRKYLKDKGNLKEYTNQFSKLPKEVEDELHN